MKSPMKVVPIDNGISEWRTMWVGDTQQIDGVEYLKRHSGGKDDVLLLVYPQVGLEFTSKILHAYSMYLYISIAIFGSPLIIADGRGRHHHLRRHAECEWIHRFRGGDYRRLDRTRDV
jgi:hypothetical protein